MDNQVPVTLPVAEELRLRSGDGRVLIVAYTLRRSGDAETTRIISPRRASRRERAEYASKIDYSDIPESSPGQLKAMRRVGRPPLGNEPRQLIAIRVDARGARILPQGGAPAARRLPDPH